MLLSCRYCTAISASFDILPLPKELQVPLIDALHPQKDAVKTRLAHHLVDKPLARGNAGSGGLGLVTEVSEPGIDYRLAEPLQPLGVQCELSSGKKIEPAPCSSASRISSTTLSMGKVRKWRPYMRLMEQNLQP